MPNYTVYLRDNGDVNVFYGEGPPPGWHPDEYEECEFEAANDSEAYRQGVAIAQDRWRELHPPRPGIWQWMGISYDRTDTDGDVLDDLFKYDPNEEDDGSYWEDDVLHNLNEAQNWRARQPLWQQLFGW